MAAKIAFYSLGTAEIRIGGEIYNGFISTKVPALLHYLVANPGEHSRAEIASMLWSDMPEKTAATNLRNVLSNARKLVGDYVIIQRQHLAFDHGADYWLDVEQLIGLGTIPLNATTVDTWQKAIDLYRGDFLVGMEPRSAEPFNNWVSEQQATIRMRYVRLMLLLGRYYFDMNAHEDGLMIANRILAIEPWHEPAHRLLMRLLAGSGRRDAALMQYEQCRQMLWQKLGVTPETRTVNLYHWLSNRHQVLPNNLWTRTKSFIGRKDEIHQIRQILTASDCTLLTILGPGGVGKTQLSLEIAREMTSPRSNELQFQDGIFFVNLSQLPRAKNEYYDNHQIATAIAKQLDIQLNVDIDAREQISEWFSEKRLLLVLNSFEHLLGETESISFLQSLMRESPGIKILITSRKQLSLRAEQLFILRGLRNSVIEDQPEYTPAVQLFIERAKAGVADFEPDSTELNTIKRICNLVDGLPLAIELAASWVSTLSCGDIEIELIDNLDLLTTTLADVAPGHRSIRTVFDTSWQMLSSLEQRCLLALTGLGKRFTHDQAIENKAVRLPLLLQLVHRSWVTFDGEQYEIPRLRLLYLNEKADA